MLNDINIFLHTTSIGGFEQTKKYAFIDNCIPKLRT